MFNPIGAVLTGPSAPTGPARQPVRRHSRRAGHCESVFWRATSRQEVHRTLLAARRYELAGRARGQRNGPLGHVALEVLELLGNLVDFRSGRLEPSLDTLMRLLRRSRDAIWRALKNLRAHGFLDWIRRFEETGRTEGSGPRVRQVSNAYRLSLPARAARMLGTLLQPAPLPEDVEQARHERAVELAAHKAGLPLDQLALFELGDTPLGQALAALGRKVRERESARRSESRIMDIL